MNLRNQNVWAYTEDLEPEDWLIASYFVELPANLSSLAAAREMAIGQSTGTWVDLPEETKSLVRAHEAKVLAVHGIPPQELNDQGQEQSHYVVRIAFPMENLGGDLSLLLTTLLGNESSTFHTLKLLDIQLPKAFLAGMPGPRFGIEGVRRKLDVYDRPLLNNMLKPSLGLSPEKGARIAFQAALGGVDIIKDDELLADQEFCPCEERVKHYKTALQQAEDESGHKCLYAANISGRLDKIRENALRAKEAGADIIMISYVSIGLSAIQALAEDTEVGLPILGHTNLAPIWYESPSLGMSSHLIVGKLPRLAGADIVVQTSPYGRYPILYERYRLYTQALTLPFGGTKPSFPLVAGGVHPRVVPRLVEDLGIDCIVGAGGAIQGHPQGTTAGATAMRLSLEAASAGIPLEDYALQHESLRIALERWK